MPTPHRPRTPSRTPPTRALIRRRTRRSIPSTNPKRTSRTAFPADPKQIGDTADEPDVADADVADEPDVEETDTVDAGTDCSDAPDLCEDPYTCVEGVCRLTMDETTWAESDFDIVEPEELTRIFEFLKSFADGVKFMVLDVGPGTVELTATYGAANVVDEEVSPIQVSYQTPGGVGEMVFRPSAPEETPLHGDSWETVPFQYELQASAHVEFPGVEPVDADFGLFAENMVIALTLLVDEPGHASGTLTGLVTREEAEDRTLAGRDQIPGFATLFCSVRGYDPGPQWNLSDILDCNEAEMDADLDDDGTMDSYRVVIDAVFETAIVVPEP